MGHNITATDKLVLRDEAWHHHQNADVKHRALTLEDLDECFPWDVVEAPCLTRVGDREIEIESRKVLLRSDNDHPLGVVGQGYVANQYRQTFQQIARVVIDAGFTVTTAGTLGAGAKGFLTAELPEGFEFEFNGWSIVKPMLNFGDSFDGSTGLRGTNAVGATVCENTFNAHILGVPAMFSIWHRAGAQKLIDSTLAELDKSIATAKQIKEAVERLTNEAFTESAFMALMEHNDMMGERPDEGSVGAKLYDNRWADMVGRYHNPDIDGIRETKLGALMAVQGYEQHVRGVGSQSQKTSRHIGAVVFSKQKMSEKAAQLIGV